MPGQEVHRNLRAGFLLCVITWFSDARSGGTRELES